MPPSGTAFCSDGTYCQGSPTTAGPIAIEPKRGSGEVGRSIRDVGGLRGRDEDGDLDLRLAPSGILDCQFRDVRTFVPVCRLPPKRNSVVLRTIHQLNPGVERVVIQTESHRIAVRVAHEHPSRPLSVNPSGNVLQRRPIRVPNSSHRPRSECDNTLFLHDHRTRRYESCRRILGTRLAASKSAEHGCCPAS